MVTLEAVIDGGVTMESVLGLVRHSGNDALLKAIEMSLLATAAGQPLHLHAEGLRGTGKTTVMRAVRRVLPRIRRVANCLYNCDPARPHCPQHRHLSAEQVESLGDEWVPMPFLEISHSAKVGTVVGSINLQALVSPTNPEAALLPGTIPQAHRGIIFVDEINRLAETAPELADILLDVMGTKPGRVQIEETGLPAVELPVQVTVWAASNPDEDPGPLEDIRRQLSDRFDFVIYTDRPGDSAVVEAILDAAGDAQWHRPLTPADQVRADSFRAELARRVLGLRSVQVPQGLRQQVADLYSRFNVESLRAVQAIQLGMRLAACLDERQEALAEDLARIAPLALRHRVDGETIKKVTAHLAGLNPRADAAAAPPSKQRFSNVSFGGAAVEPAPAPQPPAAGAQPADKPLRPAAAPAQAPRREWASQYPPQAPEQQHQPTGWFSRAVQSIRQNLGLSQPQPARRPEPRAEGRLSSGRGPLNHGASSGTVDQGSLTPPHPGRLFQRADQPGAGSSGGRGGAAQDTRSGGGALSAGGAGRGSAGVQMANPLDMPKVAPPNPARPLHELEPHELIRTEEELGRR